jgi:hypothetical protein
MFSTRGACQRVSSLIDLQEPLKNFPTLSTSIFIDRHCFLLLKVQINIKFQNPSVKLPGHRPWLPGKEISF